LQAEDVELEINSGSPAPRPSAQHPWRGYFCIAAATLCWGAAATAGKALFNGSLFAGHSLISPLVLAQTRTTFAVAVLLPFLLLQRGPRALRIPKRDLALCFLTGTLGLAGSNFFYYWAVQKTTVAVAITLQYTAPVWVLLAMAAMGRQRITPGRVIAVLLALVGTALTIGLFHSGLQLSAAGVVGAMIASFSFAFYNIAGQGLVVRHAPLTVMAYTLLGASLMWMGVNPPWRLAAERYSAGQWAFLFLFACFSTLVPYVFYFTGLKYLDPSRAIVTGCLEPVFAILFAFAFVHEALAGLQTVGIVAVLAATVLAQKKM
jgi:drug/metabolite transporter (DMT)-like permease